ncbi:hypothetical protein [Methylocystis sp. S23]
MLLLISDNSPVYPPYVDADGYQYPENIIDLFSDERLAQLGWKRPPPPAPTKDELKAYAYDRRKAKSRATIMVAIPQASGPAIAVPFLCSADNIEDLAKAERRARRDPDYIFTWARAAGTLELTATQVLAIADGVDDFTQATFVALAEIYTGIDAGGVETRAEIDAYPWPEVAP